MPLPAPLLDNRTYRDLVDEMIARIPVHTPEWTNFGPSDPGVTLLQLYAHITESMIYRANQVPDMNRTKFLQLLGIALEPAREARGMVSFANERGAVDSSPIAAGSELLAQKIPFRTSLTVDALPVESRIYRKVPVSNPDPKTLASYELLYASFGRETPAQLALYDTVEVDGTAPFGFSNTVDNSVWIALIGRNDDREEAASDPWANVRGALAGRTLSLGLVPSQFREEKLLPIAPGSNADEFLDFAIPSVADGIAFDTEDRPVANYRDLEAQADFDPTRQSGVVQLQLPGDPAAIATWSDLDPLEGGVGDLPPQLDDTALAGRIVTWLKVSANNSADFSFDWMGINASPVRQFIKVGSERLADGDGSPNQIRQLGRAPVLAGSVSILSLNGTERRDWSAIDDLSAAGAEIVGYGAPASDAPVDVFALDAEAGQVRFGDGVNGRRPREGEAIYASYDYSEGSAGNVGAGALKEGVNIPAGVTGTNPVPTWGGSDAETIEDGEKQVRRMLQHRDRLVTAEDFRSIAWRAPGIALGRVDVIPAAHPSVTPVTADSVPGSVTLMVVPENDPAHPDAPRPDGRFLDSLCSYLEPRRLVTTEIALHGPKYKGIWLSVGIEVAGGHSIPETVEAVRSRLNAFLSPLPHPQLRGAALMPQLYGPDIDPALRGWPLNRGVHAAALLAEAARAPGVVSVPELLLAQGAGPVVDEVAMRGLELPEVLGISVSVGSATPIDSLRGSGSESDDDDSDSSTSLLPVPIVAETC
ncbi:MAG: baseplate J/gp47 family protein [Erythrobacter sp.]|nr:baseplate J/gp47 family protein [Erythrobacter sp.]